MLYKSHNSFIKPYKIRFVLWFIAHSHDFGNGILGDNCELSTQPENRF